MTPTTLDEPTIGPLYVRKTSLSLCLSDQRNLVEAFPNQLFLHFILNRNLMSFSDIGTGATRPASRPQRASTTGNNASNSPLAQSQSTAAGVVDSIVNPGIAVADRNISELGDSLRKFQTDLTYINSRMSEMKRKSSSLQEKTEIEKQLTQLKELEGRIQIQIDQLLQHVNSLPRAEAAQRRHAILKIQKDFDRVKPIVLTMFGELAKIPVGKNSSASDGGGSRSKRSAGEEQRDAGPKLIQAVVGQDVDDLIMAEREQDILKLNRDIALVNEMFKDMADIVDKQGVMIEDIHTATEESRERAEAGLTQVKQAAEYQPVCSIS